MGLVIIFVHYYVASGAQKYFVALHPVHPKQQKYFKLVK
jgi:hypothetical protein